MLPSLRRHLPEAIGSPSREDLAKLRRSQRLIAFLTRPDISVRVVGMHQHADLLSQALHRNEVAGIARVTPTKVTFNIPGAEEAYIGLQTYQRPSKDNAVTGTDDVVC